MVKKIVLLALGLSACSMEEPTCELAPDLDLRLLTVSKETTFITAPLMSDGTPDYAAALNAIYGAALSDADNASDLLAEILEERFLDGWPNEAAFEKHLSRSEGLQLPDDFDDVFRNQLWESVERPWARQDLVWVAAWLDANEEALGAVAQAVQRPRYWTRSEEGVHLYTQSYPVLTHLHHAGRAFAARAMLRIAEGDSNGAAADIVAGLRLGGLVAGDNLVLEGLIGMPIRKLAAKALMQLAARHELSTEVSDNLLSDLKGLPAPMGMYEHLNDERLGLLSGVTLLRALARDEGTAAWHQLGTIAPPPRGTYCVPPSAVEWDEALRIVNRFVDRLDEAWTVPGGREREALLRQIDSEFGWSDTAIEDLRPPRLNQLLERADLDVDARVRLARAMLVAFDLLPESFRYYDVMNHEGDAILRLATIMLERDPPPAETRDGYVLRRHEGTDAFAYTAEPAHPHPAWRTFCADSDGKFTEYGKPTVSDGRCVDASAPSALP